MDSSSGLTSSLLEPDLQGLGVILGISRHTARGEAIEIERKLDGQLLAWRFDGRLVAGRGSITRLK